MFMLGGLLKTLVLGLGNPILSDDGVGIYVARAVEARRSAGEHLSFCEASVGGMRLLEVMSGYERVILVDAIQTQDGQPGQIYRLRADDVRTSRHAGSSHDLSLPGALILGRRLGMPLPADEHILIIAIEVQEVLDFGERCTPAVAAAIPQAVEAVLNELQG